MSAESNIRIGCVIALDDTGQNGRLAWFDDDPDSPRRLKAEEADFSKADLHRSQKNVPLSIGSTVEFGVVDSRPRDIRQWARREVLAEGEKGWWPAMPESVMKRMRRDDHQDNKGPPQQFLHPGPGPTAGPANNLQFTKWDRPDFLQGDSQQLPMLQYLPASQLQLGDLVLFEFWEDKDELMDLIQWVQMAQHWGPHYERPLGDWLHARWHHAAVYVGDLESDCRKQPGDDLCEACFGPQKIETRSLLGYNRSVSSPEVLIDSDTEKEYRKATRIRVRRPKLGEAGDGERIARAALDICSDDSAYNIIAFLVQGAGAGWHGLRMRPGIVCSEIAAVAKRRLWPTKAPGRLKGYVLDSRYTCAALYAAAFHMGTGKPLLEVAGPKVIAPIDLSASDAFDDVLLHWEAA